MSTAPPTISAPTPTTEMRFCPRCATEQPLRSFRIINSQTQRRAPHCNNCHAEQQRRRRITLSKKSERAVLHHAWSELTRHDQRRLCIESFVRRLLVRFNGPTGLATAWHAAFTEASATKRLRAAESMVVLLEYFQRHPEALGQVSREELDRQIQREMTNVIAEAIKTAPEMVTTVASQLGYSFAKV